MKKIILTSLLATSFLFANSAKAGFYLGADVIGSRADIDLQANPNSDADYALYNNTRKTDTNVGGGLNLGYRFNIQEYFIAPEYAYEYLNHRVALKERLSPSSNTISNHTFQLEGRHILKVNIGKKIKENLDIFGYVGASFATIELTDTGILGDSSADVKPSMIIGFGSYYHFNKTWAAKIAYDYQRIESKGNTSKEFLVSYEMPSSSIDLHTVKVGLVYNF